MKRHTFLSAAAAAGVLWPGIAGAQAPATLTIGGVAEESITPALWAAHSGMFDRAGLSVSVQSQSSGAAIAAGVAGGAYAFGKSSLPSIITAHAKGLPVVFVAPGGKLGSTSTAAIRRRSSFWSSRLAPSRMRSSPVAPIAGRWPIRDCS